MTTTLWTGDTVSIEGRRYTVTVHSDYRRRYGEPLPQHEQVWFTPEAAVIDGRAKSRRQVLRPGERFVTEDQDGVRRRWAVVPTEQALPGDHLWEAAYINTTGEEVEA